MRSVLAGASVLAAATILAAPAAATVAVSFSGQFQQKVGGGPGASAFDAAYALPVPADWNVQMVLDETATDRKYQMQSFELLVGDRAFAGPSPADFVGFASLYPGPSGQVSFRLDQDGDFAPTVPGIENITFGITFEMPFLEAPPDNGAAYLAAEVSAQFAIRAPSAAASLFYDNFIAGTGRTPIESAEVVGRFASTPEPAAWALMILGFGAVGVRIRSRERRPTRR